MMFSCSFVVGLCGLDFIVEVSDDFVFSVNSYLGLPFVYSFF